MERCTDERHAEDLHRLETWRAKLEIAQARGKHKHDKRAREKSRDWERQKQRLLRSH